jgi:hypothetical protein
MKTTAGSALPDHQAMTASVIARLSQNRRGRCSGSAALFQGCDLALDGRQGGEALFLAPPHPPCGAEDEDQAHDLHRQHRRENLRRGNAAPRWRAGSARSRAGN